MQSPFQAKPSGIPISLPPVVDSLTRVSKPVTDSCRSRRLSWCDRAWDMARRPLSSATALQPRSRSTRARGSVHPPWPRGVVLGEFPAAGSDWTSGGGSASRTAAGDWGDRRHGPACTSAGRDALGGGAWTDTSYPTLPHARPGQEAVDVRGKEGGEVATVCARHRTVGSRLGSINWMRNGSSGPPRLASRAMA